MASSFGSRGHHSSNSATAARPGLKVVFGVDRVLPQAYFYVQHAYNSELNSFYQRVPENHRIYNSKTKRWSFRFEHYDSVLAKVLSLHSVDAQPLPAFVVDGIAAFAQRHDIGSLPADLPLNIPPLLKSALLPHQVDGVRFIIERRGRGMIADEMGCGKTLQAIALAYHYKEAWPVLVLAPASVSAKWKAELLSWDPELTDADVKIISKEGHQVTKFGIAHYDLMSKLTAKDKIQPGQFGIVIADESHYLKNREAMRTQCTMPFLTNAKVAICLSGTPALSCPVELYTQLNAMQPDIFNDYFAFTERYCNAHQSRFGRDVKGCSNADELKLLLENTIMIRRLKNDVLVHALPKKVRDIVYVEPADIQMEEIRQLQDERRLVDMTLRDHTLQFDVAERLKRDKQAMTTKLYKLTGMCKIDAIQLQIERLVQRANAGELDTGATAATTEVVITSDLAAGSDKTDNSDPTEEHHSHIEAKCSEESDVADGLVDSDQDEAVARKRTKLSRLASGPDAKRKAKRSSRNRDGEGGDDGNGDDDDDDDLAFTLTTKRWRKNEPKSRARNAVANRRENDCGDDDDAFVDLTKDDQGGKADDTLDEWAALLKGDNRKKRSRTDKKTKTQLPPPPPKPVEPTRKCDLKLVLFAHHKEVLDALEIRLTELNLSYVRIDGSTPVASRHNMICRFQEDDTTTVALLGMTACGTGVNFTRASIAIFAELYWTPGVLLQAEDRIHRIGQKAKLVRVIYMLARGTADDEMWSLAQNKLAVLESTLGELEQRPAGGKGMTVGTRQHARERGQASMLSFYSQGNDRSQAAPHPTSIVGVDSSAPEMQQRQQHHQPPQRQQPEPQPNLLAYLSQETATARAVPPKPTHSFPTTIDTSYSPVKVVAAAPVTISIATSASVAGPPAQATKASGSGELSPSTRARIEANRKRALEKRAQMLQAQQVAAPAPTIPVGGGPLPMQYASAAPPAPSAQVPNDRPFTDAPDTWQPSLAPAPQPQAVTRSID